MLYKTHNGLELDITVSQANAVVNRHAHTRKETIWLAQHPEVKRRLNKFGPSRVREALAQDGTLSDAELDDDVENRYRLVYTACFSIALDSHKKKLVRSKKYCYNHIKENEL
jgi:hypothetical protein